MRYLIGPHQGSGTVDDPWRPPSGLVNSIDLRPNSAQDTPGIVFCVADDGLVLPSEYREIVRGDVDAVPRGPARQVFASALGLPTVTGSTIADWVRDVMTLRAAPNGDGACAPLMPTTRRRFELHLNRPVIWTADFRGADAAAMRAQLQASYRDLRAQALGGALIDDIHHRRVLDFWRKKYGIDDDRFFVPGDLPIEPRVPHATTIGDTFVDSDGVDLASHTATGTGGGFGWSYLHNTSLWSVLSNEINFDGAGFGTARADSDLSSDDHYATLTIRSVPGNTNATRGVACRKDGTATLSYYLAVCRDTTGTDEWETWKWVSGSLSQIGSEAGQDASVGDTITLECDGSNITRKRNGATQVTTTDASITANLRCGISTIHTSTNMKVDDFIAADLGAGPASAIPVLYHHRRMQGMS